jgi:hypothetical protein
MVQWRISTRAVAVLCNGLQHAYILKGDGTAQCRLYSNGFSGRDWQLGLQDSNPEALVPILTRLILLLSLGFQSPLFRVSIASPWGFSCPSLRFQLLLFGISVTSPQGFSLLSLGFQSLLLRVSVGSPLGFSHLSLGFQSPLLGVSVSFP